MPSDEPPRHSEPQPRGTIGEVVNGARTFAGMNPQQMNNIVLLILACFVGGLIYLDRRDRTDAQAQQLRTYEAQNELTRQAVSLVGERVERAGVAQTQAIQNLTLEVGKLNQIVNSVGKKD